MLFRFLIVTTYIGLSLLCANAEQQAIEHYVEQLDHDEFSIRESASLQLWSLGKKAEPALRLALESDSPEVVKRAQITLKKIQLKLSPNSNPKILQLTQQYYQTFDHASKLRFVHSLVDSRSFETVILIAHLEQDQELKAQLEQVIENRSVTRHAVSSILNQASTDDVIDLLNKAPQNNETFRILAHILKVEGRLNKAITNAKVNPASPSEVDKMLAFLIAKGDVQKIFAYINHHQLSQRSKPIAFLAGDLEPAFNYIRTNLNSENQHILATFLAKAHNDASLSGSEDLAAALLENADIHNNEKQINEACYQAALIGHAEKAATHLPPQHSSIAVDYWKSMSNGGRALRMIGAPSLLKHPEAYTKWVSKQLPSGQKKDEILYSDLAAGKVYQLSDYYASIGETHNAYLALSPLFDLIVKFDTSLWCEMLGGLVKKDMGEFALEQIFKNENVIIAEGGVGYQETLHYFFDNSNNLDEIWDCLNSVYPQNTPKDTFLQTLKLLGVKTSSPHSIQELQQALKASALNKEQEVSILKTLAFAARTRVDFITLHRYLSDLLELEQSPEIIDQYHKLSILIKNKERKHQFTKLTDAEASKLNIRKLLMLAINHLSLGQEQEGDKLLELAYKQTLGLDTNLYHIGYVLYANDFSNRATKYLRESLLTSETIDESYIQSIALLNACYFDNSEISHWTHAHDCAVISIAALLDSHRSSPDILNANYNFFRLAYTMGMSELEKGNKENAITQLNLAHRSLASNGFIADNFFTETRKHKELRKKHKQWFENSWQSLSKVAKANPKSHDTLNTLGWLGARSGLRLKESMNYSRKALKLRPDQPAYLDTLGEVYFSLRNRPLAKKYSARALQNIRTGVYPHQSNYRKRYELYFELEKQNARFVNGPLPERIN